MNNEKFTLEYYLEQDRIKREKRREKYLLKHPNSKPRVEYERHNLSIELYDKIVGLFQQGKTNKQVSTEVNVPIHTISVWKRKMRDNGVTFPIILGRPVSPTTCPHCNGIL